jgi:hypothetical protein
MEELFIKVENGRIVDHPMLASNVLQITGCAFSDLPPPGFMRFVDAGAPSYNPLKVVSHTYEVGNNTVRKRYIETDRVFNSAEERLSAEALAKQIQNSVITVTRF